MEEMQKHHIAQTDKLEQRLHDTQSDTNKLKEHRKKEALENANDLRLAEEALSYSQSNSERLQQQVQELRREVTAMRAAEADVTFVMRDKQNSLEQLNLERTVYL
jgi:hypothetical protein